MVHPPSQELKVNDVELLSRLNDLSSKHHWVISQHSRGARGTAFGVPSHWANSDLDPIAGEHWCSIKAPPPRVHNYQPICGRFSLREHNPLEFFAKVLRFLHFAWRLQYGGGPR